jgi:predicted ester cyclase
MKQPALALLGLTAMLAWSGLAVPTAQARSEPSMEQTNKAVARRFFEEVMNKGDLAVISELFLPGHVPHPGHMPHPATLGPARRGNEALGRFVAGLRSTFPDLHATVGDQIAEADKVVTRFTLHGTQKGEMTNPDFGTIAPTGKEVTWTGIQIDRFESGKIAESWGSVDLLGFYQQLGVIQRATPAAARQ